MGVSLCTAVALGLGCRAQVARSSLDPATYQLPYPVGDSAYLIQGNDGPWGHSGAARFAFDFRMPIGSPVHAAREGLVVAAESRFLDGSRTPGQENVVFVRHADSTFGRYYHITQNGALVTVGQRVRGGELIARSGNTGASAGPHLHFDVTAGCPEWGCQTVRIRFRNAGVDSLVAGRMYSAQRQVKKT